MVKFARFPLQRPFYCWPFGNISHVGTHVLHKTQLHLAWKTILFSLPLNMLDGHEWCVDQRKDKERWRGAEHSREEVCWLLVGSRPRPRLSAPSSTSTVLLSTSTVLTSRVAPWQIFHQMTNGTLRPRRGPALLHDLPNDRLARQVSSPPAILSLGPK